MISPPEVATRTRPRGSISSSEESSFGDGILASSNSRRRSGSTRGPDVSFEALVGRTGGHQVSFTLQQRQVRRPMSSPTDAELYLRGRDTLLAPWRASPAERPEMHPAAARLGVAGQQFGAHPGGPYAHPAPQRAGSRFSSGASRPVMTRSASARSSVIHVHIVTSACGKPSAGLPAAASSSRSRARAAATGRGGVVRRRQPPVAQPRHRRSPAADPQLPTHSGTGPARRGT